MGHSHLRRPYVSRREFLRRSAIGAGAVAAGPWFWRQLAYAAEAPVEHLHATWGADAARELYVSWMTPAPVSMPFVELGERRIAGQTVQYPGYPGFFHHVHVDGLEPATAYEYRVGAGGAATSPATAITTAPVGRHPFTFTAFGDQGVDSGGLIPASQPPNQASANTELAARLDPAFHCIVGDLAYANGDQSVWDTWFQMVSPMARSKPWMPCLGNHEIESLIGGGDSWGEWGYDPYRTRFALPDNGHPDLAQCFYAFRYGSVQFVSIDNNDVNTESDTNVGYTQDRQRAFVERVLSEARADPSVDFIIVLMHQCAFSSSSKHGSDEGVQRTWFPLFSKHAVDLVLQGHDHTYERTHAMRDDRVVATDLPARTDAGTVYIVCGNGGAIQEPFNPVQPEWSAFRQALKIGTLEVQVDPGVPGGMARLTLAEYWALDGTPIEEGIVLERPARSAAETVVAGTAVTAPASPAAQPVSTLPATGGPAGTTLVGVAAAGAGVALRYLTKEEARDEAGSRA